MGVKIEDNKLVIITESKTIHIDLPKDVGNELRHEIDSIMKHLEFLANHTIKNEVCCLLFRYKHEKDIHEHGKQ